ncbi:FKBP-type peptidyl-prolyl cis-trans isomerase [Micrococcus sp. TA1]|uniref:FKBP-type peptidyl-prolyl cis-trans isomerase n=1 Tax=Micrococcus sp. TA1 TaxID=681627 RepID=UPI001613F027|nr:FKBP-type peptidyl-prolyl cis-trans isomerase [Micrococcus sp. TA1]MBB5748952.1 peptidylprolyl isomerase [Micrococcus sp. TA1]
MTGTAPRSAPRSLTRSPRRLRAAAPLGIALAGALLLAGCAEPEARGAGDKEALKPVSLSVAEDGSPEVTVDGEIETDQVSSRVLKDGDGEEIEPGDVAMVQTAVVDPATGEVTADNFTQGSEAVHLTEGLKQANEVLYNMIDQNRVGAQVAFFMPAGQQGQGASDQLMVFQIAGASPARATGESVGDVDPKLPAVTLDEESGEPTIAKPEGKAPQDLVVQPLIQGDGAEVGAQDYVTVQYKGIKWSDGEEFDSSWSRDELSGFQLTGVIEGWTEGLQGQKVGSQVLLVVPPAKGYGGSEHELAKETLVFVVDIIHAMPPAQPDEQPQGGTGESTEGASAEPSPSASE